MSRTRIIVVDYEGDDVAGFVRQLADSLALAETRVHPPAMEPGPGAGRADPEPEKSPPATAAATPPAPRVVQVTQPAPAPAEPGDGVPMEDGAAARMLRTVRERHRHASFNVDDVDDATLDRQQKSDALKALCRAGTIRVAQSGAGRRPPRYALAEPDAPDAKAPEAPAPPRETLPRNRSGGPGIINAYRTVA